MIYISNISIGGFNGAIHGMRHPYKSTDKSDSIDIFNVGEKDHKLAMTLAHSNKKSDGKFLRMIHVQMDIRAPLYWWKEMDQYKVGTTTNSESTMHTVMKKPFEFDDFSTDKLISVPEPAYNPKTVLTDVIALLNHYRDLYLSTDCQEMKKIYWDQVIQMLPSSYMQTRTWDGDYQTLQNIATDRADHKLAEWRMFVDELIRLPYSELIFTEDEFARRNHKVFRTDDITVDDAKIANKTADKVRPKKDLSEIRLEDLELPRKLHNILWREGITTAQDLFGNDGKLQIDIPEISHKDLNLIQEALERFGF